MRRLPFDLTLYETVKRGGGALLNVLDAFGPTWQRSIRRKGGYWRGLAEFRATRDEMLDLFQEGMMREIRESVGGLTTWEGFIGHMELTLNGVTYTRRLIDLANAVRAIYSRIGDNQFTNGSGETGAWSAYNTPSTLAQYTGWVSDGVYSIRIVADGANDGAVIQTGITVVASKAYDCRCTVNVISGTWKLEIYRTDTDAVLGSTTEATAGQRVMQCSISDTNLYAGTIGVRLYCTTASGEIYADGAVFQEGPQRAETAWYVDEDAADEFGRMEAILLKGGMTDAAANSEAQTYLADHAWPRTEPQDEYQVIEVEEGSDKLSIVFYGYVWTLKNRHSLITGTDDASDHVTNLLADEEFVSAGVVQTNATQYRIDDLAPIPKWQIFKEIVDLGNSGARWMGGVYSGRKFNYQAAPTTPSYRYQNGKLLNIAGGLQEGWFAEPGLAVIDDFPLGPAQISDSAYDDVNHIFIEEVTFDAAEYLKSGYGLTFRKREIE